MNNRPYIHISSGVFWGLIIFLWVVHLAAMVGISLGYEDWFTSKTSWSLMLSLLLMILVYPLINRPAAIVFGLCFALGFAVEYLGVNKGLLFGSYSYGDNLGPKLGGVPFLIGANWGILTLISGTIASKLADNRILRVIIGSLLMLVLDIFLEGMAPSFDYWSFEGGTAPVNNYIAWFCIAVLMHTLFIAFRVRGSFNFSLHLYLIQLIFFGYFYFYFHA